MSRTIDMFFLPINIPLSGLVGAYRYRPQYIQNNTPCVPGPSRAVLIGPTSTPLPGACTPCGYHSYTTYYKLLNTRINIKGKCQNVLKGGGGSFKLESRDSNLTPYPLILKDTRWTTQCTVCDTPKYGETTPSP